MRDDSNTPITIQKRKFMHQGCGGIYGLAFLGALVYFIQHATTLWEGILGIVKALFWPAVLMYKLLEYLKI